MSALYPDIEDRLSIYLGSDAASSRGHELGKDTASLIVLPGMTFDTFWRSQIAYPAGKKYISSFNILQLEARFRGYILPILELLQSTGLDFPVLVKALDNRSDFSLPTLCKSAAITHAKQGRYILPLDYDRHWSTISRLSQCDVEFEQKKDAIVWRGVTTGSFKIGNQTAGHQRLFLARSFDKFRGHDVGFSDIVQIKDSSSEIALNEISNMVKGPLNLEEQLKYKYLLSLEGNDVASGLKWMLASNSAVIMPPPTCESWACESLLRPFEHYIPLKEDLSNVEETFEWCQSNPADVRAIAEGGKRFIEAFSNREVERNLATRVFRTYSDNTRYRLHPGLLKDIVRFSHLAL